MENDARIVTLSFGFFMKLKMKFSLNRRLIPKIFFIVLLWHARRGVPGGSVH